MKKSRLVTRIWAWSLLLTVGLGFGHAVQAIVITQALDFSTSESLWGTGGSSADFGASGSLSVGILDLFEYEIGASSGTVEADYSGELTVDYDPNQTSVGSTTLSLGFNGQSNAGRLKSDLGAFITVEAIGIEILDRDYGLNIDKVFTPMLPTTVSGSDSATGITASVDVLIAEAGVDFDIEQTDRLQVSGITGNLVYSKRGSGVMDLLPFNLAGTGLLDLGVNLTETGIWDLWFLDPLLDNVFSTSFDLELLLFEEHFGITGENCDFFICVPTFGTVRNETTLTDINVYNRDPFALAFSNNSTLGQFSITVGEDQPLPVPEPSTLVLMLLGLAALAGGRCQQRRQIHEL